MRSKVDKNFEFNKDKWVVSLINTKGGCKGAIGGHAKIIVEGLKEIPDSSFFSTQLFVAEYHIMEANRIPEDTWIPQAMRNTQCNYIVLHSERNEYREGKEVQYAQAGSDSWYLDSEKVNDMIKNIKDESRQINEGETQANFEYFGKWSCFSKVGGYNCITWAEEKLAIAGGGNGKMLLDSSKGIPSVHTSCIIS